MPRIRILHAVLATFALGACAGSTTPDLSGMTFSDDPLLGKAVWHDLVTQDIDATRDFYQGVFGWQIEKSREINGRDYLVASIDGVYVAGMLEAGLRPDGANVSRWIPYISVANVDATVTSAAGSGADVVVGPRTVALGRVAVITDPEGAVIGMARSSVGDPADLPAAKPTAGTVVWNELLAADRLAAARFYGDVFPYDASEIERRGGKYVLLNASGRERAGILDKPVGEWESAWLTYFGVVDPAASASLAEKLGGKIIAPVSPELRDGTMAVIADPSGAILALQEIPE